MSQSETITILQDVITKTQPQPILEKDLQDMHDHILSQPGGEDTIRLLGKHMSQNTTVTTMSLGNGAGAFKAKTSAKGNLLNLWFYQRVNIQANGKDFTANMGGFTPGIPVGALFGDLYYDDINDISGDYDVQVGGIMQYFSVQFIRDGQVKMSFQAGNVGGSAGVAGGRGSWS